MQTGVVSPGPLLTEYERRELIRIRAHTYLDAGYLIARDDRRGIALVKLRPDLNPLVVLFLGPLALLSLLFDRDRWVFITATRTGELIVRNS